MEYWAACWDWESPSLFGMELDELRGVLARWPPIGIEDTSNAALASVAGLRELLHGATAQPKDSVQRLIGISFDRANALLDHIVVRW